MSTPTEQILRECTNPDCSFRFPAPSDTRFGINCPKCGWITGIQKLKIPEQANLAFQREPPGPVVEALLDNIRSTFNVGAMFRTADGAGLSHLHLCGTTATPENPKVAKTALGAESAMPWSYHLNSVQMAKSARASGKTLWALEIGPQARSLFEIVRDPVPSPLLLVVGNEISGVDPEVAELCDQMIWIPMWGIKESLNVAIAFGIAAYTLRFAHQLHPDQLSKFNHGS